MPLRRLALAAAVAALAGCSVYAPPQVDTDAMRGSWVSSAFTQQLDTPTGPVSYAAWFHLEVGDGVFRLEQRHRDSVNGEYLEEVETGRWRSLGAVAEFVTDHQYLRGRGQPLADLQPAPLSEPIAQRYYVRVRKQTLKMTIADCLSGVRCITGLGEPFLREPPHPPGG
ncbi:MAG TPA: hypothetical protein VF541_04855 [Longimicrobium sp.]|jgi:hypothetical protein